MFKLLAPFFVAGLCVFASFNVNAEEHIKNSMDKNYIAFKKLSSYLFNRKAFLEKNNEKTITGLLNDLQNNFHLSDSFSTQQLEREPGFKSNLTIIASLLDDAERRFKEGKKEYALWRLRDATSACIACHSRYSMDFQFYDSDAQVQRMPSLEQGEFFLASRQYENALEAFRKILMVEKARESYADALRSILLIYVKFTPDPQKALREFEVLNSRVNLSVIEREEISGWVRSLRRWMNESKQPIDPFRKAEALIMQSVNLTDPFSDETGTVELLRATTLLHGILSTNSLSPRKRSAALYLVGLAYSRLPLFFPGELADLFLEQCIREFPNTKEARLAFKIYREHILLGYTGSHGTDVPFDITDKLNELKNLAYGIKSPQTSF